MNPRPALRTRNWKRLWQSGYGRRRLRRLLLLMCLAVSLFCGACRESDKADPHLPPAGRPTEPTTEPGTAPPRKLTPSEFRYGVAPTRNNQVVYRDDVILVGGGAESIHSVSSDGLAWNINPQASHANELRPGKIMFLTNRAVGRVLSLKPKGGSLEVILGPVELTDVIKRAHVSFEQPVQADSFIAYYAPQYPGSVTDLSKPKNSAGISSPVLLQPVSWTPHSFNELSMAPLSLGEALDLPIRSTSDTPAPVLAPLLQQVINEGFHARTICCNEGLGLRLTYDKNGVKVLAKVALRLTAPKLHGVINIEESGITDAYLELTGAAGLDWAFVAGSARGVDANVDQDFWLPVDFSATSFATNLAVPLTPTFQMGFVLHTGFTARNSTLSTHGSYDFTGSIRAGYVRGRWTVTAPSDKDLVTKDSMLYSIQGASLGAHGVVMAFKTRLIVGFGAFGFTAGPYFSYVTSIGISKNSSIMSISPMGPTGGLPVCRTAAFNGELHAGIGYTLNRVVVAFINLFLKALNMNTIESAGGKDLARFLLWNKYADYPTKCAKPASTGAPPS